MRNKLPLQSHCSLRQKITARRSRKHKSRYADFSISVVAARLDLGGNESCSPPAVLNNPHLLISLTT